MSAKGIFVITLGISLMSAVTFAATDRQPRGVNAREHRQTARIRQGVRGDELTRAELERLRADEAAVRAEERVYRRSGDGLNKREYRDLQRDLNRTSREIYRAKHNNREPQ